MNPPPTYKSPSSAFRIRVVIALLSLTGVFLSPFLTVRLDPSESRSRLISIQFGADGTAEWIEEHVTSTIESFVATVKGVRNITSWSDEGSGRVVAEFDEGVNMDQARYEIASLMRHLAGAFPRGVSYPLVSLDDPETVNTGRLILKYSMYAGLPVDSIEKYARQVILPSLSGIKGIYDLQLDQTVRRQLRIDFDPAALAQIGVSRSDLARAIGVWFSIYHPGDVPAGDSTADNAFVAVELSAGIDSVDWTHIPLLYKDGRLIRVNDIGSAHMTTQTPFPMHRINGNTAVSFSIVAEKETNYLLLAGRIDKIVTAAAGHLPPEITLVKAYDASEILLREIRSILYRSGITLLLLLLLIFMISRQVRYVLVIAISLLANLAISLFLYYLFHIEVHLYSLAGIGLSIGLIMDGLIVMIDHTFNLGNKKVFLALVVAHLTSMGSLGVVYALPEKQKWLLGDFTAVIIVNLAVSLPIAYYLVPALMSAFGLRRRDRAERPSFPRRRVRLYSAYLVWIRMGIKYRLTILMLLALSFGIPVFLMPAEIQDPESWAARRYNDMFGTVLYQQGIRPWVDACLGGSLKLFLDRPGIFADPSLFNRQDRTAIEMDIAMPNGTTIQQMDGVVRRLEGILSKYPQVQEWDTEITGPEHAKMSLFFTKKYDHGSFPFYLKTLLETEAVYIGSADFMIEGVGMGFNNTLYGQKTNYRLSLTGYNYEKLRRLAAMAARELSSSRRVKGLTVRSDGGGTEARKIVDLPGQALLTNPTASYIGPLASSLSAHSLGSEQIARLPYGDGMIAVSLSPAPGSQDPLSRLWEEPLDIGTSSYRRLKDIATVSRVLTTSGIWRSNQQYQFFIDFNFIGDPVIGASIAKRSLEQVRKQLPVGYSIGRAETEGWEDSGSSLAAGICLALVIIFFLSAIFLNSLYQALLVVVAIPVSFIGVFLTGYFFDFYFDEGGYAAFIMLSGIVVNWVLFILNDYNSLVTRTHLSPPRAYIKAFHSKIIPILLSAISNILGFLPFMLYNRNEAFWYAFAVCTTGGIVFSVPLTLLLLPIYLKSKPVTR